MWRCAGRPPATREPEQAVGAELAGWLVFDRVLVYVALRWKTASH